MFRIPQYKKGFTLIELLVVIAIISLLSSIVLASLKGAKDKAHATKVVQETKQLKQAMEMYRNDKGVYLGPKTNDVASPTFGAYTDKTVIFAALAPYIDGNKLDFLKTESYLISPVYSGFTCEGKLPPLDGYMIIFTDAKLTNELKKWWNPSSVWYGGRYCFMND